MSISVPLYGFGASGGTGDTLTVTTPGAGITVTVSKDGKSKVKISSADGTAVFRGLESGEWTVKMTDGSQTATKTATVTTEYSVELTFFAAAINVTYPVGSTCTASDGVTTLTAPDSSGVWECIVPNAGTWTVTATDGTETTSSTVSITADGQTESVTISYIKYLFKPGDSDQSLTGGIGIEKGGGVTASIGNTISFNASGDGGTFQISSNKKVHFSKSTDVSFNVNITRVSVPKSYPLYFGFSNLYRANVLTNADMLVAYHAVTGAKNGLITVTAPAGDYYLLIGGYNSAGSISEIYFK